MYRGLKPAGFRPDFVPAYRDARQVIETLVVGFCFPERASVQVLRRDFGTEDGTTGGVGNLACYGCGHLLAPSWWRNRQEGHREENEKYEEMGNIYTLRFDTFTIHDVSFTLVMVVPTPVRRSVI